MHEVYPEIEPYDHGRLDVGDGNLLYWETCGNPQGKPALVLKSGPGSGCTAGMRRYFDPGVYRTVLFDQRGCGRSTPHSSDPLTDLGVNATDHLMADIEPRWRGTPLQRPRHRSSPDRRHPALRRAPLVLGRDIAYNICDVIASSFPSGHAQVPGR